MNQPPNTTEEKSKEFLQGKDNYCPQCYFNDDKVILREDCQHFVPTPSVCEVAKGECVSEIGNKQSTYFKGTNHEYMLEKFGECAYCSPCECKLIQTNGKWRTEYGSCHTPIQTGNEEWDWQAEFRDYFDKTLKPKKPTMKNLDREVLVDFIQKVEFRAKQKAVLQERESIKKILQKECLDYCLEQNGYDYCKNCGLSLELLDNKQ